MLVSNETDQPVRPDTFKNCCMAVAGTYLLCMAVIGGAIVAGRNLDELHHQGVNLVMDPDQKFIVPSEYALVLPKNLRQYSDNFFRASVYTADVLISDPENVNYIERIKQGDSSPVSATWGWAQSHQPEEFTPCVEITYQARDINELKIPVDEVVALSLPHDDLIKFENITYVAATETYCDLFDRFTILVRFFDTESRHNLDMRITKHTANSETQYLGSYYFLGDSLANSTTGYFQINENLANAFFDMAADS